MKKYCLSLLLLIAFSSHSQLTTAIHDIETDDLISISKSNNSIGIMVLNLNTETLDDDQFLLIEFDENKEVIDEFELQISKTIFEKNAALYFIKTNNGTILYFVLGYDDKYVIMYENDKYTIFTGNVNYN